ncbi:MAG: hypothetical protein F6K36_30585, partial [Symploca sp. SIO3C6]|nr:hypothetical protein [Symploca sp. SIO3C6]
MGKKRITQLINRLKDNQEQDIKNAASIFTVAQIAVEELEQQGMDDSGAQKDTPYFSLPLEHPLINKTELLRRYGSHLGCRKAAKLQGIKFTRTPSWNKLVAAFQHLESINALVRQYINQQDLPVDNIHITIELSKLVGDNVISC